MGGGTRRRAPSICPILTRIHGGCGFRITARKQTRGGNDEWNVTSTIAEHVNCSLKGTTRGPGVAEVQPAADAIVKANPKITAEALKKTLKFQTGVDVHPRTANRLKRANLNVSADNRAGELQHNGSFLGTVTDVKVMFLFTLFSRKRFWC